MDEHIELLELTTILRKSSLHGKVDNLEIIGYKKDKKDEEFDDKLIVYINKSINTVIVILLGLDIDRSFLLENPFSLENIKIVIKTIAERLKLNEEGFNNVYKKYNNKYNLIFLGHSIGGFTINSKLQHSIHKGYCYNPVFINKKSSDNIKNYRTNLDILSIPLIGNVTKTIHIPFLDYLNTKKGSSIDLLLDCHFTTIFTIYEDLHIKIPIPKSKSLL